MTESFDTSGTGIRPGSSTVTNIYTWTYDNAGRLIREVLDSSDNTIDQTESFLMDLVGNRVRRTLDKPGTASDTTDLYTYDASDRLLNEQRYKGLFASDAPSGSPIQTTAYVWNATQQASKTITVPSVSSVVQALSYGLSGQLERVITTTRDGAGQLTNRGQVDYRYDPQGIRFIASDYSYDVPTSSFTLQSSTEYLIDRSNFTGYQQAIIETTKNAAGQTTKRVSYTYGLDEITQTTTAIDPTTGAVTSSITHTFAHDGHGSTRVLMESAAAIAQILTYSAYGELLAIHNSTGAVQPLTANMTNLLYNGESLDVRTGLMNFRARWYAPEVGRFERLDPFAGDPTSPFSFGKYSFVHGDPITGIDPTGLSLALSVSFTTPMSLQLRQADIARVQAGFAQAATGILGALLISQVVSLYGEAIMDTTIDAYNYMQLVIVNIGTITAQAARALARNLRANMIPIFPVFNALWPNIYSYRTAFPGFLPSILTYLGPSWMPGVQTIIDANRASVRARLAERLRRFYSHSMNIPTRQLYKAEREPSGAMCNLGEQFGRGNAWLVLPYCTSQNSG